MSDRAVFDCMVYLARCDAFHRGSEELSTENETHLFLDLRFNLPGRVEHRRLLIQQKVLPGSQ
jgi:hypothetical protein